jgi:hypothetical protein
MSTTGNESAGPATGAALAVTVNGRTTVTLRQGDPATFEVHHVDLPAADVWFDPVGSGDWQPVAGTTLRHVYAEPGRFEPAVRVGNEVATVRLRVLRVTRSPGAGYF